MPSFTERVGKNVCVTGGEDEGDLSSIGLLLSEDKYLFAVSILTGMSSSVLPNNCSDKYGCVSRSGCLYISGGLPWVLLLLVIPAAGKGRIDISWEFTTQAGSVEWLLLLLLPLLSLLPWD